MLFWISFLLTSVAFYTCTLLRPCFLGMSHTSSGGWISVSNIQEPWAASYTKIFKFFHPKKHQTQQRQQQKTHKQKPKQTKKTPTTTTTKPHTQTKTNRISDLCVLMFCLRSYKTTYRTPQILTNLLASSGQFAVYKSGLEFPKKPFFSVSFLYISLNWSATSAALGMK